MYWLLNISWAACPQLKSIQHHRLESKQITETSGLVAHKNKLWIHNDSGDSARIFSYDLTINTLQIHPIKSQQSKDWEDIAIDREREILYIADTGDNLERRNKVSIVSYHLQTSHSETFDISFETGSIDTEAIAWDPIQKTLYLISKGRGGTVHTFSFSPKEPSYKPLKSLHHFNISPANGLNPDRITAMDISPDGSYIAVRSYIDLFLWPREQNQSVEEALNSTPCIYPLPVQKQGESLGFQNDGNSLWTISEGKNQPIIELRLLEK